MREKDAGKWLNREMCDFFFSIAKLIYKSQAEFVKEVPHNVINS